MTEPQMTQSLTLSDFSGGMTNFFLGTDPRKYERADNFILVKYGSIGRLYTRPGSQLYSSSYPQIPAGAQRISTLFYFKDTLFAHSTRHIYYLSNTGWVDLVGPASQPAFPTNIEQVSWTVWNDQLLVMSQDLTNGGFLQRIYKDNTDTWRLRRAGLPVPTTFSVAGAAGAFSYLYAIVYKYTFNASGRTFISRSAPYFLPSPVTQVNAVDGVNPAAVSGLPAVSASIYNQATANIALVESVAVELYRTANGGQTFFFNQEVVNGVTVMSDITPDDELLTREPLYTEDGSADNDPPPTAKYVHVVDDIAYYAHLQLGAGSSVESYPNEIRQSIPGDVGSVPGDFSIIVDAPLGGITSVRGRPVAMANRNGRGIYRIDGRFDATGRGGMFAEKISDTANCISSSSIVQALEGVFWAGDDGFYFTDGYKVVNISEGLENSFKGFTDTAAKQLKIQGKYDPKNRRIYWTVQEGTLTNDNAVLYVLDLNFADSGAGMPFTTWSNGTYFAPTAIEVIDGDLVRGDSRGYVFRHMDTLYTDPRVGAGSPANWGVATIVYDYRSAALDFGNMTLRKYVPRMTVTAEAATNLSLAIWSINDKGRRTEALSPVRYRGALVWGDPDVIWGDPTLIWGGEGLIDEQRRFPSGSLRCTYKQLQLTNALVQMSSSSLLGTATVSGLANTATLDDLLTYDWPTWAVDTYISFSTDGYVNNYLVTARTDDVLTFEDTANVAPTLPGAGWVLRGYPKGEILYLMNLTLTYSVFSPTQGYYQKAVGGAT